MGKVLIVSRGVSDPDLQQLADSLSHEGGTSIEIYKPQRRGYGITLWEVLLLYFGRKGADAITGRALSLMLDATVDKVKAWYAARVKNGAARPLSFTLRDSTGRALRALKFKSSGEVEDVTGEHKGTPRQPPPDPHDTSLFESEPKVPVPNFSKEKSRTTIIFCDIPDSGLLLRKTSAARFHEWLAHCRREWSAAVERNGGVVFHSDRDNAEAYFLDSADHEDGAERAVAAALEISALTKSLSTHRVLKQARTRIGIATGVLSPYQLRPTAVLNRTCKLAAALSMTSRGDFIAVDDTTRKLIDGSFSMKDCGRNSIPLFRSPTRFWRILGRQN